MTRPSREGAAAGLRAVILAGGKGTRLRPFTVSFPKPLVPLGETPVLEVLLKRLRQFGIQDVTLTLGHLAELVKAYFEHRRGAVEGLELRYVEEAEPTGTAGSLAFVPGLNRTFLAMNGDLLTDLDFHALVRFHREQGALLTIATHTRRTRTNLGILDYDAGYRVTRYLEKPVQTHNVSMGIYCYEPTVLRHIERGAYLDFPDLVLRLLDAGERVSAFPADCQWLDIGRPGDYARAQRLYSRRRSSFDHE